MFLSLLSKAAVYTNMNFWKMRHIGGQDLSLVLKIKAVVHHYPWCADASTSSETPKL